jgi:16S rRNA (guanine966-N2)-methyltransferase
MRVVAGRFRGRHLEAPPGYTTRPITDRVKENLFNILGHRLSTPGELPPLRVLDLFSGPGSMGIEALSRGARTCTFVERDRLALQALRRNIVQLGIEAGTRVLAENAWTLNLPQGNETERFGLMFIDPPFRDADDPQRVAGLLERLAPALAGDGVIMVRHESKSQPPTPEALHGVRYVDERVYGRMRLLLLQRADQ